MGVWHEGRLYDILLVRPDGEKMGFMIVKNSDRRERVSDFAPVLSTTGEMQYAEGIWRPWTQDDWIGGLGQEKWDPEQSTRFYEAENVETRVKGKVMLATATSLADLHPAAQPVDFAGRIHARSTATDQLRRYTGTGWETFGDLGAIPTDLAVYGSWLYVACGPNVPLQRVNAGGSWYSMVIEREHLAVWDGKLWGNKGHQIFATADGSAWDTAVDVGDASTVITSLKPFAQKLYVGKEDGLFYHDGVDVVQMIDARSRLWNGNFRQLAEWEGFLYFNILRQVYKYSETAIVDVTPKMYGSRTKESHGYGIPKAFFASPTHLFVGFDGAENSYPVILAYNGLGWHPIQRGEADEELYGAGYSPEYDFLLFSAGDGTHVRSLPSMTDLPAPPYAATGAIITPRFDGRMPIVPKAVKAVTLHVQDVDADQKITVQYRKDGAENWTTAGDVTSTPKGEIALAPAVGALEVMSDIQFRFILSSSTPSLTPALEHMSVLWLPRPEAVYAYQCAVRLGEPIPLG